MSVCPFFTDAAKKVNGKRTGEAVLFNEQGKLTDETLQICKVCGVDPKDLYPRYVSTLLFSE